MMYLSAEFNPAAEKQILLWRDLEDYFEACRRQRAYEVVCRLLGDV